MKPKFSTGLPFYFSDDMFATRSILQRGLKKLILSLGLLALSILHIEGIASGAPQRLPSEGRAFTAAFAKLKSAQYSDPGARNLKQWEAAAIPLTNFLESYPASVHAPEAWLSLGKLFEKLYSERGYKIAQTRAVFAYEKLIKRFPKHRLAADARQRLAALSASTSRAQLASKPVKTEKPASPSKSHLKQPQKSLEVESAAATVPDEPAPMPEIVPKRSENLIVNEPVFKRPMVVIDPGHGGEDTGAKGADAVFEKDVVLKISKLLEELIRDRLRAQTVLTRNTDVFIPLPDRTEIANEKNADLFISIHANASEHKNASGIETYYLDNTRDKASLKLAERENASMQLGAKGDVGFMLSDLIQNVKLEDSISLAHHVQRSMTGTLSQYYHGVNNLGVKKAPFYVLVGAHMPCILAEVSFVDHPLEGKRLADSRYQRLVAQALYEGVRAFFERREKPL